MAPPVPFVPRWQAQGPGPDLLGLGLAYPFRLALDLAPASEREPSETKRANGLSSQACRGILCIPSLHVSPQTRTADPHSSEHLRIIVCAPFAHSHVSFRTVCQFRLGCGVGDMQQQRSGVMHSDVAETAPPSEFRQIRS